MVRKKVINAISVNRIIFASERGQVVSSRIQNLFSFNIFLRIRKIAHEIKDGNAYIVLTNDDGPVFKVLYKSLKSKKSILLKSLNPFYQPYELQLEDVKEVWKFVNYISSELPEVQQEEIVQGFFNGKISPTDRPS